MFVGQKGKQYGLIKPQPRPTGRPVQKPIAAFDEDDSDNEQRGRQVEQQILRQSQLKAGDKKAAALQAAAVAEDPSIFDYDGVYDSIQESKEQPRQQEKRERKSRYIESLLTKAVERKREQDVRYERQLLKEREAEDHLFGDKERFVTSAYRRKLEEDKLWLAEQKQREAEEERDDVAKRGHMGDFYRNLMKKNVAFGGDARANGKLIARGSEAAAGPSTADETAAAVEDMARPVSLAETWITPASQLHAGTTVPDDVAAKGAAASEQADDKVGTSVNALGIPDVAKGAQEPHNAAAAREEKALSARERYLARKRKAEASAADQA